MMMYYPYKTDNLDEHGQEKEDENFSIPYVQPYSGCV